MIVIGCVVLIDNDQIVRPERIDFDLAELSRTDLVLKKYVEIGICQALRFWKAEVCLVACQLRHLCTVEEAWTYPNKAKEIGTSPEESRLALPIPGSRVHEVWLEGVDDDAADYETASQLGPELFSAWNVPLYTLRDNTTVFIRSRVDGSSATRE